MAAFKITSIATMTCALALSFPTQLKAEEPDLGKPTEPYICMKALGELGLEVPLGMAVDLCAGSTDAEKTLRCFLQAWAPRDADGLGLTLGQAVRLCRAPGGAE
jgi:hypothetical protein